MNPYEKYVVYNQLARWRHHIDHPTWFILSIRLNSDKLKDNLELLEFLKTSEIE